MESFGFEKLPDAVKLLLEKVERLETLLLRLQPKDDEKKTMLNVQEAAEFLNMTVAALYTLVSRKDIPVNKPGKRLYFDREELLDWIRTGKKKTTAEIEQDAINRTSTYRRRFNP
jgi:excisionase family DNA binding protein